MMTQELSTPLWIASGNVSKAKELKYHAHAVFPNITSISAREPKGVVENETTFFGNAKLKALALAQELISEGHKNFAVIGDDSGICVDLLGGAQGIHSARYSSPNPNPVKNVEKLLSELSVRTHDLKLRGGSYKCALCLVCVVEGQFFKEYFAEGELRGVMGTSIKGNQGYAYDSVFLNPDTLQSYAEISFEEKQKDSHRRRAFEALKTIVYATEK